MLKMNQLLDSFPKKKYYEEEEESSDYAFIRPSDYGYVYVVNIYICKDKISFSTVIDPFLQSHSQSQSCTEAEK